MCDQKSGFSFPHTNLSLQIVNFDMHTTLLYKKLQTFDKINFNSNKLTRVDVNIA